MTIQSPYQLPFKPTDSVIELGGGTSPLFRPNYDIRNLPNVDRVIDLNQPLPIQDNIYDGLFRQYCLEHVSWRNINQFLKEIFRILKQAGIAVFITANLLEQAKVIANSNQWDENFSCMIFGDLDYPENSHKFGLSPEYAQKLFKEIGFQKVDTIPHPNCSTDLIIQVFK